MGKSQHEIINALHEAGREMMEVFVEVCQIKNSLQIRRFYTAREKHQRLLVELLREVDK